MTRSNSLIEIYSDPGDEVYLGMAKLDVCYGVCPTTMKAFMDETGEWIRTGPNIIANRSRYIVNDFRTEPDYVDRAYVKGFPFFTSYLEVPLISPLGYILGSYCVVHNDLYDFNNDKTVGIMNDIADTIMAHLDLMRMKQGRNRSEQLIKGLTEFIGSEPHLPHSVQSNLGYDPAEVSPTVCGVPGSTDPQQPIFSRPTVEPESPTARYDAADTAQETQDVASSHPELLEAPASNHMLDTVQMTTTGASSEPENSVERQGALANNDRVDTAQMSPTGASSKDSAERPERLPSDGMADTARTVQDGAPLEHRHLAEQQEAPPSKDVVDTVHMTRQMGVTVPLGSADQGKEPASSYEAVEPEGLPGNDRVADKVVANTVRTGDQPPPESSPPDTHSSIGVSARPGPNGAEAALSAGPSLPMSISCTVTTLASTYAAADRQGHAASDQTEPVARAPLVCDTTDATRPALNHAHTHTSSEQSAFSSLFSHPGDGEDNETPPTTMRGGTNLTNHMERVDCATADGMTDKDGPARIDGDGDGGGGGLDMPTSGDTSSNNDAHESASGFLGSAHIKAAFFRAASTIQRCMNLDGFMFLDAVPSTFTDRSDTSNRDRQHPANDADEHGGTISGPFCTAIVRCLGGSGRGHAMRSPQTRFPEAALQRFIRKFPRGHVFSADEFGPIDETYGIGKRFPGGRKGDRDSVALQRDVGVLFHGLPGAKYAVFLPLWHFHRECWYTAALGWVSDPTQAVDETDLSLVSAFGTSVMAEVSRLEALAASNAKSHFLSSISHELRSPLHGILASSELLRGSISDPTLLFTLDMLDSCGTTLLDTFNNLLDYAMVIGDGKSGAREPPVVTKQADLGKLVEDVVETVHFSHLSEVAVRTSPDQKRTYAVNPLSEAATQDVPPDPAVPLITVNVARSLNWELDIDVGAWKRIVMNLFGNALKYTKSGRIEVSLRVATKNVSNKGHFDVDHIVFTVEDTGVGMSSDYIKYRLFQPFSQENTHAAGMGLGLSIVHQLVNSIGGTINVKSSVGVGTTVQVRVPLEFGRGDICPKMDTWTTSTKVEGGDGRERQGVESQPDARRPYVEHSHDLAGKKICFIPPAFQTSAMHSESGVSGGLSSLPPHVQKCSEALERALRASAHDTLGMTVIVGTAECPVPEADIYFSEGGSFTGIANSPGKSVADRLMSQFVRPVVVVCSGPGPRGCPMNQSLMGEGGCGIHLHHPVTPTKLVAAIRSALKSGASRRELDGPAIPQPAITRLAESKSEAASSAVGVGEPLPLRPKPPETESEVQTSAVSSDRKISNPLSAKSRGPTQEPASISTKENTYPATSPIQPPLPSADEGHYLLLVDDNPVNIKLLSTLIKKLKQPFEIARNGLEAVEQYKESLSTRSHRPVNIVFMDITMPVMDGFEATRQIRQLELEHMMAAGEKAVKEKCKIIALTGLSSESDRREATASGCDLFWTKPVRLDAVRKLLAEMPFGEGKKRE
ncbi:hypothetical protein N657DRAFT_368423 [Parathielavia appendiculata]|uniref:histidine kinase n=1 Tax=Parathielavia appendiculata TaxID=2587402 RepID=A0AAN6YYU7_9PEZI|nr:hypothetical protein N657DRAFT_368423 [Parathielavia appendiculata]